MGWNEILETSLSLQKTKQNKNVALSSLSEEGGKSLKLLLGYSYLSDHFSFYII